MAAVTEINSKLRESKIQQHHQTEENNSVRLSTILANLMADCGDIGGLMVSSADGHAQAQLLADDLDYNRFAAMSSALLALSDTLISETHHSDTKNIIIESEGGNVFIMHAGRQLLLTVFSKPASNLGMSLAYARKTADEISIMSESASSSFSI